MRGLSKQFMEDLRSGMLNPLLRAVQRDRDLIMDLRDDEVHVYYKGNRLVGLKPAGAGGRGYRASQHRKFRAPGSPAVARIGDEAACRGLVSLVPQTKALIGGLRASANEIEHEQLLIRANCMEPQVNSDYFIVDRQVQIPGASGRLDATAVYWPGGSPRRRGQTVPLTLIEMKSGLNLDIQNLAGQLNAYHGLLQQHLPGLAAETEILLRQQIELGLFRQPADRLGAMATLKVSDRLDDVRVLVVLVDYNPRSRLLARFQSTVKSVRFQQPVQIKRVGFALWA